MAGPGDGADEALRVWMSDQQWMTILERIERRARAAAEGTVDGRDGERRIDQTRRPLDARCLIRLAAGVDQADGGTFLVRTRNISAGGLGFVHRHPLKKDTRCTVAVQLDSGRGMIIAGRVIWCRELMQLETEHATFEVGLQFDRPVDLDPSCDHVA